MKRGAAVIDDLCGCNSEACCIANRVADAVLLHPFPPLPLACGAAHYEDLMNAEEAGKKGKKGQWSNKEAPAPRLNDISLPGSATKWVAGAWAGRRPWEAANMAARCAGAAQPFPYSRILP